MAATATTSEYDGERAECKEAHAARHALPSYEQRDREGYEEEVSVVRVRVEKSRASITKSRASITAATSSHTSRLARSWRAEAIAYAKSAAGLNRLATAMRDASKWAI
jgi:hypothetical protein